MLSNHNKNHSSFRIIEPKRFQQAQQTPVKLSSQQIPVLSHKNDEYNNNNNSGSSNNVANFNYQYNANISQSRGLNNSFTNSYQMQQQHNQERQPLYKQSSNSIHQFSNTNSNPIHHQYQHHNHQHQNHNHRNRNLSDTDSSYIPGKFIFRNDSFFFNSKIRHFSFFGDFWQLFPNRLQVEFYSHLFISSAY